MIRRLLMAAAALSMPVAWLGARLVRGSERLLDAPRTLPGEEALAAAVDALGGEGVRFRSRDGLRLGARWLPAEPGDREWQPDPHEAVLLLHGYSGSITPDLVEFGPFLRRTAGVLGLNFRGHGDSDASPTTFGLREVEDVAGALAWLGERGVTRVAIFGTSMGGITALASVVVLGDGSLPAADMDPAAPVAPVPAPRPLIVAVVADSVAPALETQVASRLGISLGPLRRWTAARLFDAAARRLGGDPRATEPGRIVGLVEVPLLLVHGAADTTVPVEEGRRLAALAGPSASHWVVPGALHSGGHAAAPGEYERRVTDFLRTAFDVRRGGAGILRSADTAAPPGEPGRSAEPEGWNEHGGQDPRR
jgi:uncharacterized protein